MGGENVTLDAKRLLELEIPHPAGRLCRSRCDALCSCGRRRRGGSGGRSPPRLRGPAHGRSEFGQVLAFSNSWLEDGGVDLLHVVHGALDLTFHRPVAPGGSAEIASRIAGLDDKGEGKGGLILQESVVSQGGKAICTSLSTLFVRGGGGFGGSARKSRLPKCPRRKASPRRWWTPARPPTRR